MGKQHMICSEEDLLTSATSMCLVVLAKAFRVFNIKRQEMEETYHVTFSEDDEAITQSSTKGDEINFNEDKSFHDDEFLVPRSKTPQSSGKDDYLPYIEPKKLVEALKEEGRVIAMQEELNQFERNKAWTLLPITYGKIITETKWNFINKMDENVAVTNPYEEDVTSTLNLEQVWVDAEWTLSLFVLLLGCGLLVLAELSMLGSVPEPVSLSIGKYLHFSLCSGTETEEGLCKELQFILVDNSKLDDVYLLNRN
ncbi:hypothetical protein Tco_1329783 [Tanacetum coccineum]